VSTTVIKPATAPDYKVFHSMTISKKEISNEKKIKKVKFNKIVKKPYHGLHYKIVNIIIQFLSKSKSEMRPLK
jgi:hypothetical protein